jgi:hypothetical protein
MSRREKRERGGQRRRKREWRKQTERTSVRESDERGGTSVFPRADIQGWRRCSQTRSPVAERLAGRQKTWRYPRFPLVQSWLARLRRPKTFRILERVSSVIRSLSLLTTGSGGDRSWAIALRGSGFFLFSSRLQRLTRKRSGLTSCLPR